MAEDIGGEIKSVLALAPVAASSAQNGLGIDKTGFRSATCVIANGAATGSPTSYTVDAKIQQSSDDGSTDAYADVSGLTMTQITVDNKVGEINFDLTGLKKYVRVVVTPALTGGTSPKALIGAVMILGNPQYLPQ